MRTSLAVPFAENSSVRLAKQVMKHPTRVSDLGSTYRDGQNSLYVYYGDSGLQIGHYRHRRSLPDERVLEVYFADEFRKPTRGNDRLEIHILPSETNPVGFETSEWGFKGIGNFRQFNGQDSWTHYDFHEDFTNKGKVIGAKLATSVERVSESEATLVRWRYERLVDDVLAVLKQKVPTVTVS